MRITKRQNHEISAKGSGCALLISSANDLVGDESADGKGEFKNKFVVVDCGDQGGMYALENASLKEIGKRMFLIGATATTDLERPNNSKSTIVIAWENVDVLTIFETRDAFRNRHQLFEKVEIPIGFQIESLRRNLENLTVEIHRRTSFVTKLEVELKRLARLPNVDDKKIERRKKELVAVQSKLAELNVEKRQIKDQYDQLRHKAILEGEIVD